MFFAGKWCANLNLFTISGAIKMAGTLLAAATIAFLISNGSFYLFSGRYEEISWFTYSESVATYYLSYVGYAMLYSGLFLSVYGYFKRYLQIDWFDSARYR